MSRMRRLPALLALALLALGMTGGTGQAAAEGRPSGSALHGYAPPEVHVTESAGGRQVCAGWDDSSLFTRDDGAYRDTSFFSFDFAWPSEGSDEWNETSVRNADDGVKGCVIIEPGDTGSVALQVTGMARNGTGRDTTTHHTDPWVGTLDIDGTFSVSGLFIDPDIECGDAITPSADVDPDQPGVQIDVRVVAPDATQRWLEIETAFVRTIFVADADGDARITLEAAGWGWRDGVNDVVFAAQDQHGQTVRTTRGCDITLSDFLVDFSSPVADGNLNTNDGDVDDGNFILDVCGTTEVVADEVTLTVNEGVGLTAELDGPVWCVRDVALPMSLPSHQLEANAVSWSDASFGYRSQVVTIDLE